MTLTVAIVDEAAETSVNRFGLTSDYDNIAVKTCVEF